MLEIFISFSYGLSQRAKSFWKSTTCIQYPVTSLIWISSLWNPNKQQQHCRTIHKCRQNVAITDSAVKAETVEEFAAQIPVIMVNIIVVGCRTGWIVWLSRHSRNTSGGSGGHWRNILTQHCRRDPDPRIATRRSQFHSDFLFTPFLVGLIHSAFKPFLVPDQHLHLNRRTVTAWLVCYDKSTVHCANTRIPATATTDGNG